MSPSPEEPTRVHVRPAEKPARGGSDVTPATLAITALSSVVAAIVVSKVWAAGTLAATAATPVIVALVREALKRPVDKISTVTPAVGRTRISGRRPEHLDPTQLHPTESLTEGTAADGAVTIHRPRRINWRIGVATGLAGFAICVVLITVPDLVAGKSIFGGGDRTTIFSTGKATRTTVTETQTQTLTRSVITPTQTVLPAETVTVPAETVTVPAPAETTPAETAPAETTPAPAETTTTPEAGGTTTDPVAP